MLLVDGVGAGLNPGVGVGAVELDGGQTVGLGELPAQRGWVARAESLVGKEVALVGVAEANLVDGVGGEIGDEGDLRVVAVDVTALAADGAGGYGVGVDDKVDELKVLWPDGKQQAFADLPANRFYRLKEAVAPALAFVP